jgi:hypothetical protein
VKRLLACISLVAATTTAALPAAPLVKPTAKPVPAHKKAAPIRVAPADEYFGKLKMSVLGIRNTIKDVGANLDIDQTRWAQLASKAAFAEDALHDWEKKYPQDTWLAKMLFALERMYAKLDSDEGRKQALASMRWLVHDFPKSWYGRTGKKELALGKVGKPPEAAAANASPNPDSALIAAPAALTSPAPGGATNIAPGPALPEQAPGALAPTPGANPLPSMSPSTPPNP